MSKEASMLELPQEDTLSRVQRFATSRGWFTAIPDNLKEIAIKRAIETIELPEKRFTSSGWRS